MAIRKTYITKMANRLSLNLSKEYVFDGSTYCRSGACFSTSDEQEQKEIEACPYFNNGIFIWEEVEVDDSGAVTPTPGQPTITKEQVVLELKSLRIKFNPNARKDDLIALLNSAKNTPTEPSQVHGNETLQIPGQPEITKQDVVDKLTELGVTGFNPDANIKDLITLHNETLASNQ